MEFKDALRRLRSELGYTQMDLANVLHVNLITISRWENGKSFPNRSIISALLNLAHSSHASKKCVNDLNRSISSSVRIKLEKKCVASDTAEHSAFSQLIDDASFPIYICDMETYDMLYINKRAEKMIGCSPADSVGQKCYKCIMHRDSPCPFCHKDELVSDRFIGYDAFRPLDGNTYRVQGRLIRWNGRKAQVRYVVDIANTVSISVQREREAAYNESLRIRKQSLTSAIAYAHFNLTHNTALDISSEVYRFEYLLKNYDYDEILNMICENTFSDEELRRLSAVRDRKSLIRQFYEGKTHFVIRHYVQKLGGYFEGTIDLMQNPFTYDIEAFMTLRDITESTMAQDILERLIGIEYEAIASIDAQSGEAHPYLGSHIDAVINSQTSVGDNIAGVEAYLRKYCADEDIERVILETSLPYVKEKLKSSGVHTVRYTLKQNGRLVKKQTLFTYLDRTHSIILCAMRIISAE